ncbi:MAG: permease [Candidatus Zixiibacteriota bacterium]
MNLRQEGKPLAVILAVFLIFYYIPLDAFETDNAVGEALQLAQWYAREHVLLCLVPAFFIAGAIGVFISKNTVMKYLGASANKILAYAVASVSGSILAVCSCTVLPLFAGIYRMGAGLGPATTFLYAGPAINILAVILTARILGFQLGVARALGAVLFSIIIGLLMHLIFRKEDLENAVPQAVMPENDATRPLWQTGLYFTVMVGILIFANWSGVESSTGLWQTIASFKWVITSILAGLLGLILIFWFAVSKVKVIITAAIIAAITLFFPEHPVLAFSAGLLGLSLIIASAKGESGEWFEQSWGFAKQIMPLLFYGVLAAGLLLGRPGHEGLIPASWVNQSVGGNSFGANLFASVAGAFMYFATLTEIPILQGLLGNGMGQGPALALLLAGPALSLPNMLVIRSVMGTKKTVVFVSLVIIMAALSGMIYGTLI